MTNDDLRAYRKREGLTQQALAAILGVDKRTVKRWERGEYPIPGPVAAALLYRRPSNTRAQR